MIVASFDPGLRRFGGLIARLERGRAPVVAAVDVFTSESRYSDFDIRESDDRVRRSRDLSGWMREFVQGYSIDVVVAESMGFAPGSDAMVCMCLAWGVISAFLEARHLPLVSATSSYWRTCLCGESATRKGTAKARKAETARRERLAHARAVAAVPSFAGLAARLPDEHQLHALDALGVLVWSLQTRDIQELLR